VAEIPQAIENNFYGRSMKRDPDKKSPSAVVHLHRQKKSSLAFSHLS
jgi:hypothetical protein